MQGETFITPEDLTKNLQDIPYMVKNHEEIDLNKIQKFFNPAAWSKILDLVSTLKQQPFSCTVCSSCVENDANGVTCKK